MTLPSEQDANRKLTGELKQHIPTVLETVDEVGDTAGRQAKNLTPTQSNERAAVLGRVAAPGQGGGEVPDVHDPPLDDGLAPGPAAVGRNDIADSR